MRSRLPFLGLALAVAATLPTSASAARRQPAPSPGNLTVAIIPAQYFSADADSAARLTEGIRQDFTSKGWNVLPDDTVRSAWTAMTLQNGVHYPDSVAIDLGKRVNADLVVYPRLLALGLPYNTGAMAEGTAPEAAPAPAAPAPDPAPGVASLGNLTLEPAAVVHMRVLNTRRNRAIYFNQIGHVYRAAAPAFNVAEFRLPAAEGQAASTHALGGFFERVAGSREVLGPEPRRARPARARTRRGTRTRATDPHRMHR